MNDREVIARAIYYSNETNCYGDVPMWEGLEELSPREREVCFEQADSVLAAIGDRLLPALPTVIGDYRIVGDYQITPNNDDTWSVMVWDDADDLIVDGTASTPALAIRAALEADQ